MRAAFERSWNLLSAAERAVARKLSVFRGPFGLQAAQAVTGIQATQVALDVLVGAANLFNKEGKRKRALELLAFVLHHTAGGQELKDCAESLFAELAAGLPPDTVALCHERAGNEMDTQCMAHTRTVPSLLPVASRLPSGDQATLVTSSVCPVRTYANA